jgi:hypothetical protein
MRRILAVAALGAALFVSACADPEQEGPSGGNTASPTQSKAATLADKKTTCDAYLKLQADFDKKTAELTPLVMAAATDESKYFEVFVTATPMFAEYESRLTPITEQAGDTELKPLLNAELTQVKGINADIKAAGTDPGKLEAVFNKVTNEDTETTDKIKASCGSK